MWAEGPAYQKQNIYSIEDGKIPPVNYDEHTFRPHSLTHLETPAHTQKSGRTVDFYFNNDLTFFYGETVVIKLKGNNFQSTKIPGVFHWIISVEEIMNRLKEINNNILPAKILITVDNCPLNAEGFHNPDYVLTLSKEAASFLISTPNFNLYGTSWKSSDYQPGSALRPIHDTLFRKALVLENLCLEKVPEGKYFMNAFPLPLEGASESPVVPVLFSQDELKF